MDKIIVKITGSVPGNAVGDLCGLDPQVAEEAIKNGVAERVTVQTAPDKQIGNKSTKTVKKG